VMEAFPPKNLAFGWGNHIHDTITVMTRSPSSADITTKAK
jgi:hypothetical protein